MMKPSGPIGVWQFPQPIGPRTRYSPRSTDTSADAADATPSAASTLAAISLDM